MKFNSYALKGRLFPILISIIPPVMIFNHFFINEELWKFVDDFFGKKIIYGITISMVFLYFLSEVGRFFGKHLFERIYFKGESNMPTTQLLMFKDTTYTEDYKNKIHSKIFNDFNVLLPTKAEEESDDGLMRRKIIETMSLIRNKLHNNSFLLQHNIEYGTMRNVMGGAILGVFFSMINIVFFSIYFKVNLAVYISLITLFTYLILILFSKTILTFYGNNYAKILYREYLGGKK